MKYSLLLTLCLMPTSLMCMQEEEDKESFFCRLIEAPIKYCAREENKVSEEEVNEVKGAISCMWGVCSYLFCGFGAECCCCCILGGCASFLYEHQLAKLKKNNSDSPSMKMNKFD